MVFVGSDKLLGKHCESGLSHLKVGAEGAAGTTGRGVEGVWRIAPPAVTLDATTFTQPSPKKAGAEIEYR